jgi:hypothetical protein
LLERAEPRDFTLRGLVAERGLKVDDRAVWTFIHAQKLSFKKTVVASQRDRRDVAPRRVQWRKYQDRVKPKRLIFIEPGPAPSSWTSQAVAKPMPYASLFASLTPSSSPRPNIRRT